MKMDGRSHTVRKAAAILAALGLVGHGWCEPEAGETDLRKPIRVFILSGQSNMEGLGGSGRLPAELAAQPDVKIWSAILTGPDPTAWKNLGGGFGVGKGFGPEVTLGHELKKGLPDTDIYLIKSARSGTAISKSARVNFDPDGTNNEYTSLVRRVKAALGDLEKSGRAYSVEALFWMQGEADALDRHNLPDSPEPSGERYAVNLRNFITSLREDLGFPDLPVFAGRLPSKLAATVFRGNTFSKAPLVIEGQEKVARDPEMNTVLINTDDLSLGKDRLHYDTQGQLDLGRRFARKYLVYASEKWDSSKLVPVPKEPDPVQAR